MLKKIVVLLFLSLLLFEQEVVYSKPAQTQTKKEDTATYVKTFLAIVSFFKQIDDEFVKTAKKEQKEGLMRQITYMRNDMVDVINVKKKLFALLESGQKNFDTHNEVADIQKGFANLKKRLTEIDNICEKKYAALVGNISDQLKTVLDAKEQSLDKIMKDVTGKSKYDKQAVKTEEQQTLKFANTCINNIDQLIGKLGGPKPKAFSY